MRTAVIVSLLVAVTAEAPYHLPRPSANAPSFQYPVQARQPLPTQYPSQQHHHGHHSHSQSSGYNYPQPSIGPTFIQQAPQPQYIQPQPQYLQPQPAPQQQYIQPQPAPQPQYIQPQPIYQQPLPAPLPQAPISIPSTSYGTPQIASQPLLQSLQQPQPLPQPFPQTFPRPQPAIFQRQPQSSLVYHPVQYYQQQQLNSQQGYSYQEPQLRISQPQLPIQLQSQGLGSSLSSYQADSNLYSGAQGQTHREVFDSAVLDRVQKLIRENEHSIARNAGYLSLVSGVSLENAQPSVELSSFTQNSALPVDSGSFTGSLSSSSSSGSTAPSAPSAPSQDYGLPATNTAASSSGQSSSSLLPQTQPSTSYGPPN